MFIRRLNSGSDLSSILEGCPNGAEANYVIVDKPRKELERLACFANKKIEEGKEAYLKVKFNCDLGQRARILEVVTKDNETVTIYKFVKEANFDQHVIDLDRIRDSACDIFGINASNLQICVITNDIEKEKLQGLVAELGIECKVETL